MEYANIKKELIEIYRSRAKHYDFTANLYYLIGYPEWQYRQLAVNALQIQPGDTILELGCGTGLNFPLLLEQIGSSGHLIGVDLTDAMLSQAKQRVEKHGWANVSLIQSDALTFKFPSGINGVISTYALSLIPDCDQIIAAASRALSPGGHLALLELKVPQHWPTWLVNLAMSMIRPFALTDEWLHRRPWDLIQQSMQENLMDVQLLERYLGLTYIIWGHR